MKRAIYIIMMIYYVLMGIDLFVSFFPLTVINIFASPYVLIGMSIDLSRYFAIFVVLFVLIILSLIVFTTLIYFRNGKFKIIPIFLLGLIAIGNLNVALDFPTVLICIMLIIATFYISKKNLHADIDREREKERDM